MLRFLDFNDGYTSTGESGHPSDSIAAVLTVAEAKHRSGKDVITATVLAYEVFCRVCDAVDLKPLGFDHVTIGGMASTAAAARLLGLPDDKMAHAFNLGIAPNVALYQTRIGHVSMWKGCAYANASRNAVFAAMLADARHDGTFAHLRRRGRIFQGGYARAIWTRRHGRTRPSVQNPGMQHQALSARPVFADSCAGGARSARKNPPGSTTSPKYVSKPSRLQCD